MTACNHDSTSRHRGWLGTEQTRGNKQPSAFPDLERPGDPSHKRMSVGLWEGRSSPREPTQTQEEHVHTAQKWPLPLSAGERDPICYQQVNSC